MSIEGVTLIARSPEEPAFLRALNPEQQAAVVAGDGPLLVLAGAGTGKTRVLTTRLAHLLLTGRARPTSVLAVTFTNKAAREMTGRVSALLGRSVDGLWLGTFHAIGARLLRRHAELVGLRHDFTILDTDDQLRLVKQSRRPIWIPAAGRRGSCSESFSASRIAAMYLKACPNPRSTISRSGARASSMALTRSASPRSMPATSATCCCTA